MHLLINKVVLVGAVCSWCTDAVVTGEQELGDYTAAVAAEQEWQFAALCLDSDYSALQL